MLVMTDTYTVENSNLRDKIHAILYVMGDNEKNSLYLTIIGVDGKSMKAEFSLDEIRLLYEAV